MTPFAAVNLGAASGPIRVIPDGLIARHLYRSGGVLGPRLYLP